MSSVTLCLFSVALCNVGNVDQYLFGQQQPNQQNQNLGFGGQATNIFNGFANAAGLGQFTQQNPQGGRPKPPYPSPCRQRFQYVTDGREWKGIIRFKNMDLTRDNVIAADFILPQGNVS